MNERAKFARQTVGSELTGGGLQKRAELDGAIIQAEQDFRAAEDCETESRVAVAHAEIELQHWVNNERLRRQEAIKEKPKTPPLVERLAKLKSKLKA